VPLLQAYGLTETSPAATINPLDMKAFNGAIGLPISSTEVSIRDDVGSEVPITQVGEVCILGPQVMKGYWQQPGRDRECPVQPSQQQLEGTAYRRYGLHGRRRLALPGRPLQGPDHLVGLQRLSAQETLLAHPAVQNAAVVGLPHPQWGEAVSAFVKLKPGAQASEAEIAEHCRRSLGGFQVPKLVRILEEMPMTATGKLRKVELRQAYGDHFAAKSA